jgi:glycosyltransferase involved in cell wall biosynthesis
MTATVSIAMIVRNEEAVLGRCLASLAESVDEIIVVDTGSHDATRDVASRYTRHLYDFAWVQDFAAARQHAFNQAHSEWVAWVDADDVVLGAEHIRRLAADAPANVGAIHWPYVVAWDSYGNPTCQFWRERLVRNNGSYHWSGSVHEVLVTSLPWQTQQSADIVVEHHPPSRTQEYTRRNLEILQAEYANCQGEPSPRLLFYLAREYAANSQPQRALEVFAEHQQHCTWDDERYQALLQIATILLEQSDGEQALDTLWQALKLCPHWPDAYYALARVYYFRREWHKVVHWTELGRAMPLPETPLFINPMDYRFNWIIYYTNALYWLGDVQNALDWTGRALQICAGDAMHRDNRAFFQKALSQG